MTECGRLDEICCKNAGAAPSCLSPDGDTYTVCSKDGKCVPCGDPNSPCCDGGTYEGVEKKGWWCKEQDRGQFFSCARRYNDPSHWGEYSC